MLRKSLWLPNQKPIAPVDLDWDNWLLKRISPVGVYIYQDDAMVNLVTGIPAIARNAPPTVIDRDGGRSTYSGTYPDNSSVAPHWDTGIKGDNSMRFVAAWHRYRETPAANNYFNGSHDLTNRFYVNPTSASLTQPLFSWGNTAYTPTLTRSAPANNVREMLAMSVSLSGNIQGYINGAAYGAASAAATFSVPSTRTFYIGKRTYAFATGTATAVGTANTTDLVIIGRGTLSNSEVAELYRNPYQILKPRTRRVWVPVTSSSGADLSGYGASQSGASGTLSTAIGLNAAAVAVATGSGSLGASIQLSGAAAAASYAEGVLTASIRLSGEALAQALAGAGLSTGINLAASGSSSAEGSSVVTTQITLSGSALAQAMATADLGTTPMGLSGNAAAFASAAGALMTEIKLAGDASAIAFGSGGLTTGIPLQAGAAAVSNATGDLTVSIEMSADAMAQAIAAGDLSAQIMLSASALSQALASAALTSGGFGYVTPDGRVLSVNRENRILFIRGENRILGIPAENRVFYARETRP